MSNPNPTAPTRRAGPLVVGLLLVLLAAACGEEAGSGSAPTTRPPADTASTTAAPGPPVERGAPRFETVTTLSGTGPAEPAGFDILADAIQWRVRWKCDTGQLRITTDPPPRKAVPLVDGACPGQGEGFAIVTGRVRLKIEAGGPWQIMVDQQIDTPLREPPFEGMASAPVLRQGTFAPLEKAAKGTARIYQRADGTRVLRLEEFEVTTNVDLFIWLSEAPNPKTGAEVVAAPHKVLGNLRSTLGDQNYVLPADLPIEKVRSIVIWCEPVRQAYGAAALAP